MTASLASSRAIRIVAVRVAAVAVLLVPPPSSALTQAQQVRDEPFDIAYRQILNRYRDGDVEGAVRQVSDWRPSQFERVKRFHWADDRQDEAVAAVLHTEAAIRRNEGLSRSSSANHLTIARWLVAQLASRQSTVALVRAWYGVVAAYLAGARDSGLLLAHADRARAALGDDPETQVALGDALAQMATTGAGPLPTAPGPVGTGLDRGARGSGAAATSPATEERGRLLDLAAASYSAALNRLAGNQELRLKLGRVFLLAGRYDSAIGELTVVERQVSSAGISFLASLYLGVALDAAGRVEESTAAYRRACAGHPAARSSALGLGEILHRTGRAAEAKRVLDDYFEHRRAGQADDDPWPGPEDGPLFRFDAAMARLRGACSETGRMQESGVRSQGREPLPCHGYRLPPAVARSTR